MKKQLWDIFCQVIDNWGDAGICWRLARQLSTRGVYVRLWVDNTAPLAWMDKDFASYPNIEVLGWQQNPSALPAGDMLIEAFGCRAPEAALQHLLHQDERPPVWLNLEYLTAQAYAEQYHGLPSPQQSGPGKGLTCWFFYPGFSPRTGGLLRESNLSEQLTRFNATQWLAQQQIPVLENVLRVSLFSYENKALPALWKQWQHSTRPVHLMVTPGISTCVIASLLGEARKHPSGQATQPLTKQYDNVTVTWLPFYSQQDFDHLLWSCDVNFVRGEDSWVRAIWAAKPFIWQPYIQDDGEHLHKLEAFLDLVPDAQEWATFERLWSGQMTPDWNGFIATLEKTTQRLDALRGVLWQQPDLVTSLIEFVQSN